MRFCRGQNDAQGASTSPRGFDTSEKITRSTQPAAPLSAKDQREERILDECGLS